MPTTEKTPRSELPRPPADDQEKTEEEPKQAGSGQPPEAPLLQGKNHARNRKLKEKRKLRKGMAQLSTDPSTQQASSTSTMPAPRQPPTQRKRALPTPSPHAHNSKRPALLPTPTGNHTNTPRPHNYTKRPTHIAPAPQTATPEQGVSGQQKGKVRPSYASAARAGAHRLRLLPRDPRNPCTEVDLGYVRDQIWQRILAEPAGKLRVETSLLRREGIHVECEDRQSLERLRGWLQKVSPAHRPQGYLALAPGEHPPYTKFYFWTPEDLNVEIMLRVLEKTTPGFVATDTTIIGTGPSKTKPKTKYTSLAIMPNTIEALSKVNYRPSHGWQYVHFKRMDDSTASAPEEPEGEEEADGKPEASLTSPPGAEEPSTAPSLMDEDLGLDAIEDSIAGAAHFPSTNG